MRNTPKSPCRRWMIGKRNGRKTHITTRNQSCCRWISDCSLAPPKQYSQELTWWKFQHTLVELLDNGKLTSRKVRKRLPTPRPGGGGNRWRKSFGRTCAPISILDELK